MIEEVMDNALFVVCSPRMPTAARSTGEGSRNGTRIEEVKQIVLSEALLKPLATIKSRLRRMFMRSATPVDSVGAWLVPLSVWPALKVEIDAATTEWKVAVDTAAASLDVQLDALCAEYPDQANDIRANALNEAKFRRATKLILSAFSLSKDQVLEASSLADELGGLALQVLDDLAKLVIDGKRDKGSGRFDGATRDFIEVLAAKAHSFEFVDARIGTVAGVLDRAAQSLKGMDKVIGPHADMVASLFAQLTVPRQVLEYGLTLAYVPEVRATVAPAPAPAPAPAVAAATRPQKGSAQQRPRGGAKAGAAIPAQVEPGHQNPVCI